MTQKIKDRTKTLKILLTCLILLVLIYSVGSMIFIKMIYDENFTKVEKPDARFTGYLTYSDIEKEFTRSQIQFESGKNMLTGYIYGEENTKGLVVISHGLGFGAEKYLPEALYFVDNGWRVFSYNNTGTHESGGNSTVGLPQSLLDLKAALAYIESIAALRDLPVMLYGHSWGGYAVTSVLNYDHDISAVVSLAGFNSPGELLNEQLDVMLKPFSFFEYPFGWLYQTMVFGSTAWVTAVDGINSTDIPVMILHGDKDESIAYKGASIISHKDQITNPNVVYKTGSIENRNGHNNLLRSPASVEYIKSINEEYKKIFDSYNGKIPDDIKAQYYEGVDKFKASELDADLMNEINSFYEAGLGK